MQIYVQIKRHYGAEMIYPDCDKSKLLAELLRQTTLTRRDLGVIKKLGFLIDQKQPDTLRLA
jgi:hypothetical protein